MGRFRPIHQNASDIIGREFEVSDWLMKSFTIFRSLANLQTPSDFR